MGNALVYGRGPKSLADQLGVSVQEAKGYIQKYFSIYSGIGVWLDRAASSAVRTGQCRTINNRVRYFEFDPYDRAKIAGTEREGKNTPIQGSSADITKLALYLVHTAFDELGLTDRGVKMVNCIHDEIVVEAPVEVAEEAGAVLKAKMEEAGAYFIKSLPINADMGICESWSEK